MRIHCRSSVNTRVIIPSHIIIQIRPMQLVQLFAVVLTIFYLFIIRCMTACNILSYWNNQSFFCLVRPLTLPHFSISRVQFDKSPHILCREKPICSIIISIPKRIYISLSIQIHGTEYNNH